MCLSIPKNKSVIYFVLIPPVDILKFTPLLACLFLIPSQSILPLDAPYFSLSSDYCQNKAKFFRHYLPILMDQIFVYYPFIFPFR